MIKYIVIDDEEHTHEVIRSFCKKIPYLDLVAEFTDPIKATSFIDSYKDTIDLVFLDIEMPQFSGIDLLKAYSFPNVIMVTGYANFALDSYQYGVVDYLLKPFSFDRFSMAVNKVQEKQKIKNSIISPVIPPEDSHILYLKTARSAYIKLSHAEIKYIQGAKNYAVIKTSTTAIVASERLNELEQLLTSNSFIRIHKSYIINVDHFESLNGNRIQLKAACESLPLGATYRQGFLDYITKQMRSSAEKKQV